MIKVIIKISMLPAIIIFAALGGVLKVGIKVYCLVFSIVLKILSLCALIAVCTSQWQPLMIIGIMLAVVLFLAFEASFIVAKIEICRDNLCSYLRT